MVAPIIIYANRQAVQNERTNKEADAPVKEASAFSHLISRITIYKVGKRIPDSEPNVNTYYL